MMGLVILVHTVGNAIHQLADMEHRPRQVRTWYLMGWMLVTVLVVGVGLTRVRKARRRR